MKTISIDLETFSSIDLAKAGVYKYASSPDFEILLFGYSVDGGDVRVVDLTAGEAIPADVLDALTDDSVIKTAHNSNFERVCLSRYLSDLGISLDPFHDAHPLSTECARFLNPAGWHCTMIWAAYMGLPLSLADTGAVLGLEKQKLSEGKDLIRYFCKPCEPTKTNGGRTRNRPADAPEKWELFKSYNLRDVETELEIEKRLSKFPVPEDVWDQYHIDQEINDRGIAIDDALVENAIRMDARSRAELTELMQKLTNLDNPNSVQQMKQWLINNGMEIDSLGKKQVQALLQDAPPQLREVLLLRQQLAKSSVKKYIAMKNAVCDDGRVRGMFQFYGAVRSGRWAGRLVQLQNLYRNSMGTKTGSKTIDITSIVQAYCRDGQTGKFYLWGYGTGGSSSNSNFRGYSPDSSYSSQRPYITLIYDTSKARIFTNGAWETAVPYVYHNGIWQPAQIKLNSNGWN